MTSPPLAGLQVVDFSRLAPGPFLTMILSDFGADVVCVESPDDDVRGRDWDGANAQGGPGANPLLRNKKSVVLDLKQQHGLQAARELVERADIVVDGFRPGAMDRLGIGYEQVRVANPGVIFCSITAFGVDGDRATLPGHDLNFLALTGMLDLLLGHPARPLVPTNVIGDIAAGGLYATIGVLLAVIERQRSGVGQFVELSMTDGLLSMLGGLAGAAQSGGAVLAGRHRMTGGFARYNVYRTRDDRFVVLGGAEEKFWTQILDCLGLARSPEPGYEEIAAAVARHDADFFDQLAPACMSRVHTLDEALADAEFRRRGALITVADEDGRRYVQPGVVPRLHRTPGAVRDAGSKPGADSEVVLAELGFRPEMINEAVRSGAVRGREGEGTPAWVS